MLQDAALPSRFIFFLLKVHYVDCAVRVPAPLRERGRTPRSPSPEQLHWHVPSASDKPLARRMPFVLFVVSGRAIC